MPLLTKAHLEHIARCGPWQPVELPDFALALIGAMTLGDQDALAWAWLSRDLAGVAPDCDYCCAWVCHSLEDKEQRSYLADVSLETATQIPPGLVRKDLPRATYLRFTQIEAARDLELLRDYMDYVWLPQSDYRVARPCYLVRYAAMPGLPSSKSDLEVYMPVERRQS